MTPEQKKTLTTDPDGLLTYEFIANHIGTGDLDMAWLTENMINVDPVGQFTASAARYLHAIDPEEFAPFINELIAATINKDREHRYLPSLMAGIYGCDYQHHAAELSATDDNFRRLYKRLHPNANLL